LFKLIGWSFFFTQFFAFAHAAPNGKYFDILAVSEKTESCPSPLDIKNKEGVFTSAGKSGTAQWVGVLLNGEFDHVMAFERGIFFLTQKGPGNIGILSGCLYKTMGGEYLNMQLDSGTTYNHIMWVGRSLSWTESRKFSSPAILECSGKFKDACSFSMELIEHSAID